MLFLGNHVNRAIIAVTSSTQTNFFLTVGGNSLDGFLAAAELTCTDFMFLHARLSPVFLGSAAFNRCACQRFIGCFHKLVQLPYAANFPATAGKAIKAILPNDSLTKNCFTFQDFQTSLESLGVSLQLSVRNSF